MITNNIDLSMVSVTPNGGSVEMSLNYISVYDARRIAKGNAVHNNGFLYTSIEDEAVRLLYSKILGNIELKYAPTSSVQMKDLEHYIVGRYQGPEIKLGDTKVPNGGSLRWIFAEVL